MLAVVIDVQIAKLEIRGEPKPLRSIYRVHAFGSEFDKNTATLSNLNFTLSTSEDMVTHYLDSP